MMIKKNYIHSHTIIYTHIKEYTLTHTHTLNYILTYYRSMQRKNNKRILDPNN